MKYLTAIILLSVIFSAGLFIYRNFPKSLSGAPPYGEAESDIPDVDPYAWLTNWKRPDGSAKVGLQIGHWKSDEFPDELKRLRGNTGASGAGMWEWEVNQAIALETKKILEDKGITVDLLPATVPSSYWADAFVAIHADGSTDRTKSGFKIASSWRDFSGKAGNLVSYIKSTYEVVGLSEDPNITRNMRGYYAFSWWRYEHAIHPMTTAAIVETGFLTNPGDQKILIKSPQIPAKAIAEGILLFLQSEKLIPKD